MQHFIDTMQRHLSDEGRVVIGFSGGVDSRVLLRLAALYRAQRPNLELLAVHVHHGLSQYADQWLEQCQAWAEQEQIPFVAEYVSLDLESGDSVEQLARDARYRALASHINTGDILLTGQHLDDQTETFLLALKRGSGPKGLSSMAQLTSFGEGELLRPLLDVSRTDIEHFAHAQQLVWLEDDSNQDTRFDRNFLRHQVIPVITERWPSFSKAVRRSARLCAKQEQLLAELLQPELQSCLNTFAGIDVDKLSRCSALKRDQLLRMWLETHTTVLPSETQLQQLWKDVALAKPDANPTMSLATGSVRRFRMHLYWIAPHQDITHWRQSVAFDARVLLPDGLGGLTLAQKTGGDTLMQLDRTTLTEPLVVMFEPEGLSAHPHGRAGSRKLKKLFQEYHIPSWQRRRTPILMMGDKVVAVANLFVDKDFYGSDCELVWDK
ncbi:tRNA lysidine(34) synthetase TilS [Vibrio sp. 10N]